MWSKIKDVLLGKPLKNDEISHERMSRFWGLPIMASDALSSVAYSLEEILLVLVPVAGIAAYHYVGYIVLPILGLLLILVLSYSQIISHYPKGGGAFAVSRENIGDVASLICAAALIIDYILTVAVSISSATAAITSALPSLSDHKVLISLLFVLILTLLNLRGLRESSKAFGLPTYLFILSMAITIVTGLVRLATGTLQPIEYAPSLLPPDAVNGIGILLILRGFASGCSAMSGIEAVSDAVPSFREPSVRNAKHILYMLGGTILFIFGGITILALNLHVVPLYGHTVLSQIAMAIFGNTPMYYIVQLFTALILVLAANTAYNGLPILLSILAHNGFAPRQFSFRGTKLSFSNGILFLAIIAGLLIINFQSDTHRLIPLYAVGVFISFTLAQFGMFLKWGKLKEPGWHYKSLINGFGALVTLAASVIVFATKFIEGAWMLAIAIPILVLLMYYVSRHYHFIERQIELPRFHPYYEKPREGGATQCILLVHDINKPFLKAINYANTISNDITALHICRHPDHAEALRAQWKELDMPVPLTIVETPYRDIIKPLNDYLLERESKLGHGDTLSVIVLKYVSEHWYDAVLHNQTTYFLEHHLNRHRDISTIILPFHYTAKKPRTRRHFGKHPKARKPSAAPKIIKPSLPPD